MGVLSEIDGRALGGCSLRILAQVLFWDAVWGVRSGALRAVLLEMLACNRWGLC